jgi:hypothetical protein
VIYTKQNFVNNQTVLKAEHLDHMEEGIYRNSIENVKVTPQNLTEAQKEQVRVNIGITEPTGQNDLIISTCTGEVIKLLDASNNCLKGLSIYGRTEQNGTPTPNAPVVLENVGAPNGNITVSIGTSEEDSESQALTVTTPNGLPGVPVESGGNYIDKNGQWWICDEIDFANGKYIKRVNTYTTNSSTKWNPNSSATNYIGSKNIHLFFKISDLNKNILGTLCDGLAFYKLVGRGQETYTNAHRNIVGQANVMIDVDKSVWATIDEWTNWVTTNPLTFQYILATPVETDLSANELAVYAELYTIKPVTVISNDANADMTVSYVADTKNYLDNKVQNNAQAMGGWTDEACIDAFLVEANAKAYGLGMSGSEFNVPSGLPNSVRGNNISTAEDVMKLGLACYGSEILTEILAAKTYTFRTKGGSNREITIKSLYHTGPTPETIGSRGYHLFGGKGGSLKGSADSGQGSYGILNNCYLCSVGNRQAVVAILGHWLYDLNGVKQTSAAILADILDYIYATLNGQNPEEITIGENLSAAINREEYPISVAACLVPMGNTAAWSWYSKDALLAEKGSYSVRQNIQHVPASVTKLLTALVTVQTVSDLDELVTIHESDKVGGSGDHPVYVGETMSFRDLLYLSLLESNNDATTAIARAVGEKILQRGTKITYNTEEYTMKAGV